MRRRLRLAARLLAMITLVLGCLTAAVPRTGADTTGSFNLVARADAMSLGMLDPAAPVVAPVVLDASPATAQASLDSLGQSMAFASLPYPGEFVATLPGTVNGLRPSGTPAVPGYPLYVTSSYPATPRSTQSQGPYSISAASTDSGSVGEAVVGLSTGSPEVAAIRARAEGSRKPDGRSVVADAVSDAEGVAVGPAVRIASVISHVRMTLVDGQPAKVESALRLGAVTVAGTVVGLTEKGVEPAVPGGPSPDVINEALKNAGVGLRLLPASRTPTSFQSGGLEITYATTVPGHGKVTAVIVLGRVSATLQSATAGVQLPATGVGEPVSAPPAESSVAAPVLGDTSGATNAEVAGAAPRSAPRVTLGSRGAKVARLPLGPSGRGFYLTLMLAGAATVAGAQLIRLLAVRLRRAPRLPFVARS